MATSEGHEGDNICWFTEWPRLERTWEEKYVTIFEKKNKTMKKRLMYGVLDRDSENFHSVRQGH